MSFNFGLFSLALHSEAGEVGMQSVSDACIPQAQLALRDVTVAYWTKNQTAVDFPRPVESSRLRSLSAVSLRPSSLGEIVFELQTGCVLGPSVIAGPDQKPSARGSQRLIEGKQVTMISVVIIAR